MSRAGSSGLRHWFLQRLSALYLVAFLVVFALVWSGESISYDSWRGWVAHPLVNAALLLFVLSLLVHGWIGIRDVIIDYIKPVALRYVLLITIALCLIGLALWTLKILLVVSLS